MTGVVQERSNSAANKDSRRRRSLSIKQSMKRSEIQMIVVIVADQDEVDGWKTLDEHPWICHSVDAEHTRADRIEQNRIGDDVQVWRLDEYRGVADPEHPDSMEQGFCGRLIGR